MMIRVCLDCGGEDFGIEEHEDLNFILVCIKCGLKINPITTEEIDSWTMGG